MKLTVEQWLQRIADPVVRESALKQMLRECKEDTAESISGAIQEFQNWDETKEGWDYWEHLRNNPPALLTETPQNNKNLFNHMADNHGLTLSDDELNDIINVVKGMI